MTTTASCFREAEHVRCRNKWTLVPYYPRLTAWPYTKEDFARQDSDDDAIFYAHARLRRYIHAFTAETLMRYYHEFLPRDGRLLDFCASYDSHYPPRIHAGVVRRRVEVWGIGVNRQELFLNSVFQCENHRIVQDLNGPDANIILNTPSDIEFDAATCSLAIGYLIHPVEVLKSLKDKVKKGGSVHVVMTDAWFPSKVIKRFAEIDEYRRCEMVGDYLHYAGWVNVELISLFERDWANDFAIKDADDIHPLWVVKGMKS
jgi:SAM-dependent methyltransferase